MAEEYTIEDYANEPISSAINPNVLVGDKFNEQQLDFLWLYDQMPEEDLAEYDQIWFKRKGITFTEEMEHLINSEKSKLRPPILIKPGSAITGTNEWQDYLQTNANNPSFVPTTDPDEIKKIMGAEDAFFSTQGYVNPEWHFVNTYRKSYDLAKEGIPWEEGAGIWERTKAATLPRNKNVRGVESITGGGVQHDEFGYRRPNAEYLYPGRPPGEQGPIIRNEYDEEGNLVETFPFNAPGVDGGDFAEFLLRETPSLAAEFGALKAIRVLRKPYQRFYKSTGRKVVEWGRDAAAMGTGAGVGEFARLAFGYEAFTKDIGLMDSNEFYWQAAKDSGMLASFATAGNATITAGLAGMRGIWYFATGKKVPDYIATRMLDLRNDWRAAVKAAGIEPGSKEAKALLDDLIGKTPSEIKKRIKEVTGKNYEMFLGEGSIGPDADFALSMMNLMRKEGLTGDMTFEILENQILNNDAARLMFVQDILMNAGTKERAYKAAADLGQQLGKRGGIIEQQLKDEIDTTWDMFEDAMLNWQKGEKELLALGIDDVTALGILPASNQLPGALGDDVALSKYLFQMVDDPNSMVAAMRQPKISRLALMQQQYMRPVVEELDKLRKIYGGLNVVLTPKSPLAIEIQTLFKKGDKMFRKDPALAKWLSENIDGPATKKAIEDIRLWGLRGLGPGGPGKGIGGDNVSFNQLHEMRTKLWGLHNSIGNKISEPNSITIKELISAIDNQIGNLFKTAARKKKPKGESVDTFMERTGFGKDYWDALNLFGERSKVANHRFIQQLVQSGKDDSKALVNALMTGRAGGTDYHPMADALMNILRDSSIPDGLPTILRMQKAVGGAYKRDVIEPFISVKGKKDFAAMTKAHDIWMNKHGGLIKSVFPEEGLEGQIFRPKWNNMNSSMQFVNRTLKQREKVLEAVYDEFAPIFGKNMDPETMILEIVRGQGLENVSGAIARRTKLMQVLKKHGDKNLLQDVKNAARMDFYGQIVQNKGGRNIFDADKFNELLTKDFPLMGKNNKVTNVSFEKIYAPFLGKQTIDDLYTINAAVQYWKAATERGTERAYAVLGAKQAKGIELPVFGRLLFGPLNPYTWRLGWRERALADKVNRFLGEMITSKDPKLLNKVVKQLNRKTNITDAVRFLNTLESTAAYDVGRELRALHGESESDTAFLSESDSPFRTQEYSNFLDEWLLTAASPTDSGIIPADLRGAMTTAPLWAPPAAAGAVSGAVSDTWDWFFPAKDETEDEVGGEAN